MSPTVKQTVVVVGSFLFIAGIAFAETMEEVEGHFQQGFKYAKDEMFNEAIDEFSKVVSSDPAGLDPGYHVQTYSEAYFHIGVLESKRGQLEEGTGAFKKAIGVFPDHARAHYYLAGNLVEMGEIAEAIEHYKKAVSLGYLGDPRMGDMVGDMLKPFGARRLQVDYQSLLEVGKRVTIQINGNPDGDPELIRDTIGGIENVARTSGKGLFTEANVQFIRSLEEGTVTIERWTVRDDTGESEYWVKYDSTPPEGFPYKIMILVAETEAALEAIPENSGGTIPNVTAEDFFKRAGELMIEGKYHDAEREFKQAIREDPDYALAYFGLGMLYMAKLNRPELAVDSLKEGIQKAPSERRLHFGLATAYLRMGNLEEAEKALQGALAIDPEYQDALQTLEIVQNLKGKVTKEKLQQAYQDHEAYTLQQEKTEGPLTTSDLPEQEFLAILDLRALGAACQSYRKAYGTYPKGPDVLVSLDPPYLTREWDDKKGPISGYYFFYSLIDQDHFEVFGSKEPGHRKFYMDQTGDIRVNDRFGKKLSSGE